MDSKKVEGFSSSSSSRMSWKYDVFVSFRGEDTRNNFTDHIFGALDRNYIHSFRDDNNLKKGESLAPELLQAIESSQVLMVVFSKNYASSIWCLQELSKIADCIDHVCGHSVLPIFYDVDPSQVRNQSGFYGRAFAEYEERFKQDERKIAQVQRWRGALKRVADLSGWDVRNKPEYAEIEKIIKVVTSLLAPKFPSLQDDLVGMHSRVEELEMLMDLDNDNVLVVGIHGMGGIGKSTLATTLYDKISNRFDASCFIDDVGRIYRENGPLKVQKQLLVQILKDKNIQISNLSIASNMIRTRLCHIKALIVLDNVDKIEQLDKLALKCECLGAWSRIIIISRDVHILREHEVDAIYKVKLLNYQDALQLFCRQAFKSDDVLEDYKHLIDDVLNYANGLPLAIRVLGSFLFGRDVSEWRSALVRLREKPTKDIMDVLQISFDGLQDEEKEIFLDIACFFNGRLEEFVMEVLDCFGLCTKICITVLIDKSLITRELGNIWMHDLLVELGRSIVRGKSPNKPRKWSRLWDYEDFYNVMLENLEAENLEAIVMDDEDPFKIQETTIRVDALSKMSHLKLLIIQHGKFSGSLHCLSNELTYVCWKNYPFSNLPSCFQPNKLFILILRNSNIKQLWEGTKDMPNLRILTLEGSKSLIEMPDLSGIPNLEELDLEGCVGIEKIDPSICYLTKLEVLNLKDCENLVSIPDNIFSLSSLQDLNISGCLKLLNSQLLEKPRQAGLLERHEYYSIDISLLSMVRFPCLTYLDLSFCNLIHVPAAIESLHCLECLSLGGNNFVTLPSNIKELSKLRQLNLEHCKQLKYLPELPLTRVESIEGYYYAGLNIFDCPNLAEMEHCFDTVFSWTLKQIELNMQSSLSHGEIEIIVPGAQLPEWFNKQNEGTSISLDLSPSILDQNWIGIACCATFVTHDDPSNLIETGKTKFDIPTILLCFGDKKRRQFHCPMSPINLRKDLLTVEFDHLWLQFFTRERFIDYVLKETHHSNDIELETMIVQPQGLRVEVKFCGYRWIFEEDLQQLTPQMLFGKTSSSRKRKLLTND